MAPRLTAALAATALVAAVALLVPATGAPSPAASPASEEAARLLGAPPSHPLVFVPGLTSSNLTFTVLEASEACPKLYKDAVLYPPPTAPAATDPFWKCWAYALRTTFDATTGTFHSEPGIQVDTVDYPRFIGNGLYIAQPYWEDAGYVVNKTLFCASFDWRMPSAGLEPYFAQLKSTVEQASALSGGVAVDLAAVSFGPQIALSFLHRMTAAWKKQYIRWFVAESPVWSGSPTAALALTSGYTAPGAPPSFASFTHFVAVAADSLLWLLPRAGSGPNAWNDTEVIIETPNRNYTASGMTTLLTDLGYPHRVKAVEAIAKDADLAKFDAPGVDTFVVYGTELDTISKCSYNVTFKPDPSVLPPLPASYTMDPATGDGLVNRRSSERSLVEWPQAQKASGHKLYHKAYPKQQHAACCLPSPSGQFCFIEVIALLKEGKIPAGVVGN